jgi:hypothetical protein
MHKRKVNNNKKPLLVKPNLR